MGLTWNPALRGRAICKAGLRRRLDAGGVRAEPLLEFRLQVGIQAAGFDEEGIGPGGQAHGPGTRAIIGGDHEDDGWVFELLQTARHLGAVEMRQMKTHQDQLWSQGSSSENCLTAIGGGANNLKTMLLGHEPCQGSEDERGVIHQEHPDAIGHRWRFGWIVCVWFHDGVSPPTGATS
jgi:hypothetical protein